MNLRSIHIALRFLIPVWFMAWVALPVRLMAQSNQKETHIARHEDSLRSSLLKKNIVELNEQKAQELIRQALEFEQKQELRNALRALFQALNFYEKANNQIQQVAVLQEIGRLYDRWEVPERAIDYFQRALIKINSHNLKSTGLKEIYAVLGESYLGLDKYDQAEKNLLEALNQEKNGQNISFRRRILSELSQVYMARKNFDNVLKINLELVELERKSGAGPNLSFALNNVGFIYKSFGDYEKALMYINQALEIENEIKSNDVRGMISMRINLASTLNLQKRFNMALTELFRALKLADSEKDYTQQAEIRNYIALLFYNTQDYHNANYHCQEAVSISERSGNYETMLKTYKTYGLIMSKLGAFKEAYQLSEKCNELKDSIFEESNKRIQDKLLKRINIERTEKELKLLLIDSEKSEYELQKLSLEAERKQKDLELLTKQKELQEVWYKTESLENERALQFSMLQAQKLKSEKMMQEMALQQFESAISEQNLEKKNRESRILLLEQEKNILEKNKKLQKSQLQAQSTRERYLISVGILIALVLVIVIYGLIQFRAKNASLKKKQVEIENANAALEELNQEIYTKNTSITNSIKYASGIQLAILPEASKLQSVFSEYFVFYQPKDIVSGDFYFLTQYRKKWFLAFADCTGHGVPGALMSLIGHNLLTGIIEVHGITEPSLILKEMDIGIRKTLKTKTSESRDGMELGLCIFDFENDLMEFASSMRPLYGIRNGTFFEWKGDRHTLGSDSELQKTFQSQSCPIHELDALYLCSDGYQDQLGGPLQKRFLSNRLKDLLQGIAEKPMHVQGKIIEFTMKEWIGDGRQLDDIMVIGLKPNGGGKIIR